MASRKDGIYGLEIGKGITLAQYLPEDNAVGSIVIKPISDAPAQQYDATLRSELKDLIADLELKRQWVAVSLPSEFAIVKKVSLDGDEDDPGEAILWELSQHVIGSIEEYSVDFDPIGKPSPDAVQQYLVVAYRTASVRKLVSLLKANKLSPCIVDLDMFAIINVFEANYPERLSQPALLVLATEDKTTIILTHNGTLVDFDVFFIDQGPIAPDVYADLLQDYSFRLCSASSMAVPELFCAGPLFSHPEYRDSVARKHKSAGVLDPFKKIQCRAAKGDNDMSVFAPQLAVAVGLALRGQTEL